MNGNIVTSPPYAPTPKLATSGIAGTIATLLVWVLNKYCKADIPAEIASQIAVLVGFMAGYFAPHSAPTQQQLEEIKEKLKPDDERKK